MPRHPTGHLRGRDGLGGASRRRVASGPGCRVCGGLVVCRHGAGGASPPYKWEKKVGCRDHAVRPATHARARRYPCRRCRHLIASPPRCVMRPVPHRHGVDLTASQTLCSAGAVGAVGGGWTLLQVGARPEFPHGTLESVGCRHPRAMLTTFFLQPLPSLPPHFFNFQFSIFNLQILRCFDGPVVAADRDTAPVAPKSAPS